ncbi:Protein of unknown function [Collimonas sp. OK607]|uniref:DUF1302 domain-containing protein n=1 Tax=Collimonas sp. OK607 TaxID=1798194 RepID=UPI0008E19EC5|nr:DUF1302 domain-containing protein [Collimonas sp. OK607]SFB01226.1 Protein of unknown function [Collimonas sp. OK607]
MNRGKRNSIFVPKAMILAITAGFSSYAFGVDFQVGDGWQGSWTSSISAGSSWRASNPDSRLYGQANGALVGRTNGTGANTIDEGNLNYGKGDQFSSPFKLLTEVEIKKGDMGVFVRAKAWYDYTLENQSVKFGNQPNGYNGYSPATNSLGSPRPLSDNGFEPLNKFQGISVLDAYVYDTFNVNGNPLQVRLGNQVVNWGEGIFIQGVNQISAIDVPSFHKPGAQLKEVYLPVPMLFASQGLGEFGNVEGFYQFKWRNTPIDSGCGNYWALAGGSISSTPGGCNNAVTLTGSNPLGYNTGAYVPTIAGREPKNTGEFGLAYHFDVKPLDTEFGLYAMKINPRTPVATVNFGNYASLNTVSPISISWDYPKDMKVFGVSAATNLFGWSVAGELSYTKDFPAQLDGNDLLFAGLAAGGLIVPGSSIPLGPLGPSAVAAAAGNGVLGGYTLANKTQFQVNAIKVGNGILGASQYSLIGEVGFQWNNLPNYKDDPNAPRYNRAFIFGAGSSSAYGGSTCGTLNISADGCKNDGYATPFAWGYRLKGELTYPGLFAGVTVQPSVFWSHDVQGYSIDGQFLQGRMALGLGARFTYDKKYALELNAVQYNRHATYDPLSDRSFFSAIASMSF